MCVCVIISAPGPPHGAHQSTTTSYPSYVNPHAHMAYVSTVPGERPVGHFPPESETTHYPPQGKALCTQHEMGNLLRDAEACFWNLRVKVLEIQVRLMALINTMERATLRIRRSRQ